MPVPTSGYVIVTMMLGVDAPINVYGNDEGKPFATYDRAKRHMEKMRAADKALWPGEKPVHMIVRKVTGGTVFDVAELDGGWDYEGSSVRG